MRRFAAIVGVVLLLAACGDDDDGGSEGGSGGGGNGAADVVLPAAACDLVEGVEVADVVGFDVEALSSSGSGTFNDFEFESCSGLETDGGEHPRSVSVQLMVGGDPEAFREEQAGSEADDVDLGDLPDGTFTTDQFGSVVVWVPAGDGLMGVSVTRTVEGDDFEFESDNGAAVALSEAILSALAS